jgi:hypothetical protein
MENDSMDETRRTSQRRRALKEAKVVLSDWSTIDCVIRDMSETGAKVQFGGPTELPGGVRLLIMSSNLLYPGIVAWQRGQSAGIHFTGAPITAPPRKY